MTGMTKGTQAKVSRAAAAALCAVLVLGGCATRRDAAPVVDRSPPAARAPGPAASVARAPAKPAAAPQGYYIVQKGDTLYSIALEHGADYREVADWNSLDDPTKIYVGQQLRVTEPPPRPGVQVGAVQSGARPEARPLGATSPEPAKAGKPAVAEKPVEAKPAAVPAEPAAAKAAASGAEFIWPAKGKVIAGFGESRSKGIDIDGKPGDPIIAAAGGRVTYTGTGIPGLGKLVVIKHDNGFITVYAHNRDVLVKEQQAVSRGQKIAELGSTDSERPKLHFQIRKGSAPVDPMRYLPAS